MSEEFKEITGAVGFQFEKVDDQIEGELTSIEDIKTIDGVYKRYTVKDASGESLSFNGTSVIMSKLKDVKIGQVIRITYLSDQKSASSGRVYKDFKVEVK